MHAKKHTGDVHFPFPKWAFDYNDAFKWNAKNQTLAWIICSVFPTAVVKIKGNMQQITQHSSPSLFFVNFYVCWGDGRGGGEGGLLFYYEPKQAVKSSPFLSRNIILPPEGAIVESAPSRPNLTRPEVNGPGGAGWPGAPEPSRHTTGRGCRHPPVKRLLPAVVCGVFFFFFLIPRSNQEVIGIPKKKAIK